MLPQKVITRSRRAPPEKSVTCPVASRTHTPPSGRWSAGVVHVAGTAASSVGRAPSAVEPPASTLGADPSDAGAAAAPLPGEELHPTAGRAASSKDAHDDENE